jgi:hypothetical protein
MKRLLPVATLLAALAVTIAAGSASAQTGINLAWSDCGSSGTVDKTFACATNTGAPESLFGSFYTPSQLDHFISVEGVIDIISQVSTLPNWWNFRSSAPAGCRNGASSVNGDFGLNSNCDGTNWSAIPSGGPTFTYPFPVNSTQSVSSLADSLRHARIKVVLAVPGASETVIVPNTHYYAFKLNITHAKTVGTGSCAGCAEVMCLVLNQIRIVQPAGSPGGNIDVTTPNINTTCTWQGGPGAATCNLVPARRTTWGQVKGLYR